MAASGYTPIQIYHSTTASAAPTAGNLVNGELAINILDGKLYYKDNGGVVQVIATKGTGTIGGSTTQVQYNNTGALAGSANFTFDGTTATINTLNLTNALGAAYGGTAQSTYAQGDLLYASAANTLAKLPIGINTYILTSNGTIPGWSIPSSVVIGTATNLAGGAAGSVPYQSGASTTAFLSIGTVNQVITSTGSAPQWSSALTLTGLSNSGLTTLDKTVTVGNTSFNGAAVFAPATPAKVYLGTGTVTDVTSAIAATNAAGAIVALGVTPIAATNANVTYTNASTLYIAGAPSAGTNITITNPYALYVAAGDAYFGASVSATTLDLTNLEVTNIKAKDGTASITLADSTGVASFTANPILSGGTANGVVYLNASKVATTGSALTFDGSEIFKNSGGTIQNNDVRGSAAAGTRLSAGGTLGVDSFDLFQNAVGGYVFNRGNTPLIFGANNAEWMRLTSTGTLNIVGAGTAGSTQAISFNGSTPVDTLVTTSGGLVGIGTSSPGAKLNTSIAAGSASATNIHYLLSETGTNSDTGMQIKAINSTNSWDAGSITFRREGAADSYGLVFATSSGGTNNNRLFLNSSGNLGLGVTPSAWGSDFRALNVVQFSTRTAALFGGSGRTGLGLSLGVYHNNTNWIASVSSAPVAVYEIDGNGAHTWSTYNGTVTAGNAISFTQAMTLDASGRLMIGTTTPQQQLTVSGAGTNDGSLYFNTTLQNATTAATSAPKTGINFQAFYQGTTALANFAGISGGKENTTDSNSAGVLIFSTAANTAAPAERARITSGGDLQIANGNLVMSTSGKGIDFSATSSGTGTMTSELLNDYEEGDWTPSFTASTSNPTVTYVAQVGKYTKIGRLVTFTGYIQQSAFTGGSGDLRIAGLPFTSANVGFNGQIVFGYHSIFAEAPRAGSTQNSTTFDLYKSDNASFITGNVYPAVTVGNVSNTSGYVSFSGFYYV